MYLGKVKSLAMEIQYITIGQTLRHGVRHVDALTYLAATLDVDSPRTLQINIKETRSIEMLSTKFNPRYISECLFAKSLPEAVFAKNKVITRKKRRDTEEELMEDPDMVISNDQQ